MKTITISAKCSDMFSASYRNTDNPIYDGEYDGYVPDFFPGNHYGDYVKLEIDIDTGKILNWKTPTTKQLKETFKKNEENN